MNLFRSEESVRAWSEFDPQTERSIKSVADWAGLFTSVRVVKHRLDPDFVEKSEEYGNEAFEILGKFLS